MLAQVREPCGCPNGLSFTGSFQRKMHMQSRGTGERRASAWWNWVIVIVIIGVIAANCDSAGDAGDQGRGRVGPVQRSVHPAQRHRDVRQASTAGRSPGQAAAGGSNGTAGTSQAFVSQTDHVQRGSDGTVATARDKDHAFGPTCARASRRSRSARTRARTASRPTPAPRRRPPNRPSRTWAGSTIPPPVEIVANSTDKNDAESKTYDKY